jgi:hypothetical protein
MCKRRPWKMAPPYIGSLFGNMEVGLMYQGILRGRWRRALEMEYLTVWELCEGT